jgi:hypothetical protein
MYKWLTVVGILLVAAFAEAQPQPTLVFDGYIDYPARHDYRIEIYSHATGLISRIVTYSGVPLAKYEEMVVSARPNGASGIDRLKETVKTIELTRSADSVNLVYVTENTGKHTRTEVAKTARIAPEKDLLFEDDDKRFRLERTMTFRVESKNSDDQVVIRENKIFDDGWYRSDWKKEEDKTIIQEYTTMEIQGDWITDGGGVFTGKSLYVTDPAINIMNYYILDAYLQRRIFLPFIFGLKTGSY